MQSDLRLRRTSVQQQQAGRQDGCFFDGQRWVPQERRPVRRVPSGPIVFNIGDDETSDEDSIPQAAASSWEPPPIPVAAPIAAEKNSVDERADAGAFAKPKVAVIAFASLAAVALISCIQAGLLVRLLPPGDVSGGRDTAVSITPQVDTAIPQHVAAGPAADSDARSSSSGIQSAVGGHLVHWRGVLPVCPGERFHVGERLVKLRETADKESREVARLSPGTVVERTGPCENQRGLVRMPLRVLRTAAAGEGVAIVVHGWATLTAEFVQGPRFFEEELVLPA